MRARFERRGLRMPAVNEKQADFLVGARVLENPRGTAPGFWAAKNGVEIVVLPGVPSEMREIMEGSVLPILRERAEGRRIASARPADRRHGRVLRRRDGRAHLREVAGASGHDPRLSRRGPASPASSGRAGARERGPRRHGARLPRSAGQPDLRTGRRGPERGGRPAAASVAADPVGGGILHGRDDLGAS